MKTTLLRIQGRVQGVGYRKFAARLASEYGLTGFALNEKKGSVLIAVQGDDTKIHEVIRLLAEGPKGSEVTSTEMREEQNYKKYDTFIIAGPGYLHSDLESL